MTDSKKWCDGDWRCRSSSKPFAGAESGSPGRALEAGKRGSPGRPVQAGIRGKRLIGLDMMRSIGNLSSTNKYISMLQSNVKNRSSDNLLGIPCRKNTIYNI